MELNETKLTLNGNGACRGESESERECDKVKQDWQGAVIKDKSIWFTAKCGSHEVAQVRYMPTFEEFDIVEKDKSRD